MPAYFPLPRPELPKARRSGAGWAHLAALAAYFVVTLRFPFSYGLALSCLLGALFTLWYESIVPCVASVVLPLMIVSLSAAVYRGAHAADTWPALGLIFLLCGVSAAAGWTFARLLKWMI